MPYSACKEMCSYVMCRCPLFFPAPNDSVVVFKSGAFVHLDKWMKLAHVSLAPARAAAGPVEEAGAD